LIGKKVEEQRLPVKQIWTTVSFDMCSLHWAAPTRALFQAAVEMAAYADGIGIDRIDLMEHPGSDDGYLPHAVPVITEYANWADQ